MFLYLLKNVEIGIIQIHRGTREMKQQVLKALANPSRIFYVPYSLAVINFFVQFVIFMVVFVADLLIHGTDSMVNPAFFLISVIIVHSILAIYSKRDPQIGQIITARIQLMKKRFQTGWRRKK